MSAIRQITTRTCPVTPLARETALVAAAHDAADRAWLRTKGEKQIRAAWVEDALHDRLEYLAEAASQERAQSAEGALLQLLVAHGDMIELRDVEGCDRDRHFRRLARCLYSIRGVLEQIAGTTGEAMGGDYYMFRDQDPFAAVAAALEGRKGAD